jgi:hypothetical protein
MKINDFINVKWNHNNLNISTYDEKNANLINSSLITNNQKDLNQENNYEAILYSK